VKAAENVARAMTREGKTERRKDVVSYLVLEWPTIFLRAAAQSFSTVESI